MHSKKSKIVYCKDGRRKKTYPSTKFDFLGYTFCQRGVWIPKKKQVQIGFNPAVSKAAVKAMRAETRRRNFRNRTDMSLKEIAQIYNPVLRGWLEYYGRYYRSGMKPVLRHFNITLTMWARRKHKKLTHHKTRAQKFIKRIAEREPELFVHWHDKIGSVFA